jgi:hypothetical protein
MKMITRTLLYLIPAALLAAGCSNNPAEPDLNADREAIKKVIESDTEMFGVTGFDDNGAQPPSYDTDFSKITDYIEPLRFGRRGRPRLENVEVEFTSDTTAVVTVTHSFDGNFFILAKDTSDENAVATLYKKEMKNLIYRKVKFKKVRDTGFDRLDWRITYVSMADGGSPETTLDLQKLVIDLPGTEDDIVVEDPLEYFFNRREGLPMLSPGDTVKVFVTVSNTNNFPPEPGETVLLRYKMDHRILRARRKFNDSGEYPDEVAGDGTYSGYWVIGHRRGVFHAAVDIFDNGTLYDDAAPYNSVFWAMPYRVRR